MCLPFLFEARPLALRDGGKVGIEPRRLHLNTQVIDFLNHSSRCSGVQKRHKNLSREALVRLSLNHIFDTSAYFTNFQNSFRISVDTDEPR